MRQAAWQHTLNLAFDIVNCVRRLHLKGDSLTRKGFDEDLHDEDLEDKATVRFLYFLITSRPRSF